MTLSPITRKRLRRFRQHRRAWWSLWILATAYAISLGAELICNSRPLLMRYDDRWYVPVLRFYPDDVFTGSGRQTRPDYRAIKVSPAFQSNPRNFMLFPPVPFDPYESIDPASLRDERRVTVSLAPTPRVASVNVNRDLVIVRAIAGIEAFFPDATATGPGPALTQRWQPLPALRDALDRRLRNLPADAQEIDLPPVPGGSTPIRVVLTAYQPRPTAPDSVRLTLREPEGAHPSLQATFAQEPAPDLQSPPPWWQKLPAETRASLSARVLQAFNTAVYPEDIEINGQLHRVRIAHNEVTWPYRPVRGHWMGMDSAGRDVFARILYGFRISITFGFLLVLSTMVVGIVIGAIQGYFGGKVDLAMQRLIEIWSALPFLYVMILLGSVYGRGFVLLLVCYGIFNWIGISYYMRAEFLRLRRQPYIEAARCQGLTTARIMARHVFPNATTPLITPFPFSLVGAIASLYGLDYLGFGLPPPTPSWGELLYQAQQFRWAWWLILYPATAIFSVMLLGVFVGEGVRDAFDPKAFSRMQ